MPGGTGTGFSSDLLKGAIQAFTSSVSLSSKSKAAGAVEPFVGCSSRKPRLPTVHRWSTGSTEQTLKEVITKPKTASG